MSDTLPDLPLMAWEPTKVTAASLASLVAGFVVGRVVLKVPGPASVAEPLRAAIPAVVTSGFAFVGGWLAKHTPPGGAGPGVRPSLPPRASRV